MLSSLVLALACCTLPLLAPAIAAAQCAPVDTDAASRPWDLPAGDQAAAVTVSIANAAWLAEHPAFGERFSSLLGEHGLAAADFHHVRLALGDGDPASITLAFESRAEVAVDALGPLVARDGVNHTESVPYPAREPGAGGECRVTHVFSTASVVQLGDEVAPLTAPIVISMTTPEAWRELDPALLDVVAIDVLISEGIELRVTLRDEALAEQTQAQLAESLRRLASIPEVSALGLAPLLAAAQVSASGASVVLLFPPDAATWEPAYALVREVLESEFE